WAGFGQAVESAGDVNGDGYSDVIVGAPYFGGDQGRAYVFLGSPSGLSPTQAWTMDGAQPTSHFGSGVAGVGDVDGDGFDDVVVGAMGDSLRDPVGGTAQLYRGSPTGPRLSPRGRPWRTSRAPCSASASRARAT